MEITIGYRHLYRLVLIQNFVHALWDTRGSLCTVHLKLYDSGQVSL